MPRCGHTSGGRTGIEMKREIDFPLHLVRGGSSLARGKPPAGGAASSHDRAR